MIYVSSDWHGVPLETIKALLEKVGFGESDYLFVLGDVVDRGAHGVELLKAILYAPNIGLIRGNHEQMLLACDFLFDEITERSIEDLTVEKTQALRAWQANGAGPTITGLSKESPDVRKMLLELLREAPLYDTVSVGGRDYLLVHAGLRVHEDGTLARLGECSEADLLWSRPTPETRYSTDFTTVLGHTPTCLYGAQHKGRILRTDTWINVDTGAAFGSSPALLRLDDLEEFYLDA